MQESRSVERERGSNKPPEAPATCWLLSDAYPRCIWILKWAENMPKQWDRCVQQKSTTIYVQKLGWAERMLESRALADIPPAWWIFFKAYPRRIWMLKWTDIMPKQWGRFLHSEILQQVAMQESSWAERMPQSQNPPQTPGTCGTLVQKHPRRISILKWTESMPKQWCRFLHSKAL